jgi:hypothetical protein
MLDYTITFLLTVTAGVAAYIIAERIRESRKR